eukprot:942268-Rhodomonas_salina.1
MAHLLEQCRTAFTITRSAFLRVFTVSSDSFFHDAPDGFDPAERDELDAAGPLLAAGGAAGAAAAAPPPSILTGAPAAAPAGRAFSVEAEGEGDVFTGMM